jgi:hypothetical protein
MEKLGGKVKVMRDYYSLDKKWELHFQSEFGTFGGKVRK